VAVRDAVPVAGAWWACAVLGVWSHAVESAAGGWVVTTVLVVTCAVWVDPQSFKLDSSPSSARVGSTAASMACTASWAFAVSIKPGCTDLVWVWGGW
jgi:hypothetical protein